MKNKIKDYRKAKNIKLYEMAKMLGVTRQTYTNYESGEFEPSFDTLLKISKILKTSLDDLLNNDLYPSKRDKKFNDLVNELQDYLDKYK
jgi:transcriptional regulator with XRE-family HTH domain